MGCADFAIRVLGNMTSLQKLESGLLKPEPRPTCLPDVLREVASIVRPQLQQGVELRLRANSYAFDSGHTPSAFGTQP